jgi:hypothetical protein
MKDYTEQPNPFANAIDDVDHIIDGDGKVYVSIHTIDLANAAIYSYVSSCLENQEIPEDFLGGIAWTMITYQQLHDALSTRENLPETVDDLTALWEDDTLE